MKSLRKHSRLLLVAVACLAVGAGASAITSAGAASRTNARLTPHQLRDGRGLARLRAEGLRLVARRAVHGDLVVATKNGFVTVTFDRGSVSSVSGQQLTINEGTAKATYKQVNLTIPTTARVRDNGQKVMLSQLKQGQRVIVVQTPTRTFVIAHTPQAG
jgi:hypothetical protein